MWSICVRHLCVFFSGGDAFQSDSHLLFVVVVFLSHRCCVVAWLVVLNKRAVVVDQAV